MTERLRQATMPQQWVAEEKMRDFRPFLLRSLAEDAQQDEHESKDEQADAHRLVELF